MDIKPLTYGDYEILKGFWHSWGFEAPCRDFLPDNGLGGYMICDDVPVCAGFIYATNAQVAWISWLISNKHYRKKPQRSEAITALISFMTDVCRDAGYKYVYSVYDNRNLTRTFAKLGYIKGSDNATEMTKIL